MKFGFKRQITVLIPISVYTLYSVIMFMTFIYNSILPSKENWMITKSRVEPNKFLPRWEEISITRNSSLSQRRFDHVKFIGDKTKFSSEQELKYPRVYINNEGLGQNGTGVIIHKTSLDPENQKLLDEGYKLHAFNSYVSNLISVDRRPPHVRDPLCKTQTFPEDLPETSVIITFLNEAWSVLVRSVHSVINTTPPALLKEIILVDDFSDYDYLKESLDVYMRRFPKVTVIHNMKREGLIRSRLKGAKIATGKVLTFLDSHIECAEDWLPPLLARIKENPKHVVWPSISSINKDTFQFKNAPSAANQNTGIFTWRLDFTWEPPNIAERDSPISPIRSPTMAGGIFSIDRRYFYHIGSYDDQMMLWGAENLELSFRVLPFSNCNVSFVFFFNTWRQPYQLLVKEGCNGFSEIQNAKSNGNVSYFIKCIITLVYWRCFHNILSSKVFTGVSLACWMVATAKKLLCLDHINLITKYLQGKHS